MDRFFYEVRADVPDVVSGRLRGKAVAQLKFENDPILGILRHQEEIALMQFDIDLAEPGVPQGDRIATSRLMEF